MRRLQEIIDAEAHLAGRHAPLLGTPDDRPLVRSTRWASNRFVTCDKGQEFTLPLGAEFMLDTGEVEIVHEPSIVTPKAEMLAGASDETKALVRAEAADVEAKVGDEVLLTQPKIGAPKDQEEKALADRQESAIKKAVRATIEDAPKVKAKPAAGPHSRLSGYTGPKKGATATKTTSPPKAPEGTPLVSASLASGAPVRVSEVKKD